MNGKHHNRQSLYGVVDLFLCFHSYYLDAAAASLQDFMDPDVLDGLQVEINHGNEATRKFAGGKQLWIGETSSAWGGGAKGLSDGFVAAFMWAVFDVYKVNDSITLVLFDSQTENSSFNPQKSDCAAAFITTWTYFA